MLHNSKKFSKLYNNNCTTEYDDKTIEEIRKFEKITNHILVDPPNKEKMRKALLEMKNKKIPGPNKIPPKVFKYLGRDRYTVLYKVIHEY